MGGKMVYAHRTIENTVKKVSNTFPVVLITGPRQVGKTTVLRECDKSRKYVSLDDVNLRLLAKESPELFLDRFAPPVLIDEIQYAPELLPYIKIIADERQEDGLFWLTGSQQFQLMQGVTESLAGRIGIVELQGFSIAERTGNYEKAPFLTTSLKEQRALSLTECYDMVWRGCYPKMVTREDMDWDTFYKSYVTTYIERDVRDLVSVGDEMQFYKFVRAAAARSGQMLDYTDISKDVGVSVPTVKSWVSILKNSGLVFLLEPYSKNITKRIVKTPKLYFWDTGLVCYLTGWLSPESAEAGAQNGALFENFAIAEILKSYMHNGKRCSAYFYRDQQKKEIDLIIEENGVLFPIEFKKTSSPKKDDVKNFSVLESLNTGKGAVVCLSSTHFPLSEDVDAVPVSYI